MQKLVVFNDYIGRTMLGEEVSEKSNQDILAVKNPVIIQIMPTQDKGVGIHFVPLFFRDFLAIKDNDTIWIYNRNNIVQTEDIELDARVFAQYNQVARPAAQPVIQQTNQTDNKVIKLFDE